MLGKLVDLLAGEMGVNREEVLKFLQDPYNRRGLASIIKGIATYGVTRPQVLYAPFMVVWDFTKRCNLRCRHCYANASPLSPPDELTLEQKLEVLRQLDEAGVAALSFSGGEPLMSTDFWLLAEKASEAGMYVSVATNGTLITENVANKLKEVGVRYVEVSLDSVNPEKHDSFRGVPGSWERAVRGIRNAKRAGLEVGIAMTVTKLNYRELPDMIDLAKELKVDRLIAFNFVPTGRGKESLELDLSAQERVEVLNLLYRELSQGELQAFSTSPLYSVISLKGGRVSPTHFADLSLPLDEALPLAEFLGGCGAGRIYCSIEYNGDVQPCVFLPVKVGNVLKDGFLNIWHNSPLLMALRDRDRRDYACHDCPYKYVCGGCRARAYAYFGDPLGPDPGCPLRDNEIYAEHQLTV